MAIEPRLKHPAIFEAFDVLDKGEAIIIRNDHDPRPLYYQLAAERGNTFSWVYLLSGPEVWEVEIRKHKAGMQLETVGEIAAADLAKGEVFKKYGIDFCCGGKKTLEEACSEKGLDVLKIRGELDNAAGKTSVLPKHDFNSWSLTFLSDYIVNVHHSYVKQTIPVLIDLGEKVSGHHGKTNPELVEVKNKVKELVNELTVHMKKEEMILFPYIKELENNKNSGTSI